MADGNLGTIGAAAVLPVDTIRRTRQDFPGRRLSYEIQLESDGWRGLAALAQACDAAGLKLVTLKCVANGNIFCALADDGSADLDALARGVQAAGTVSGWTTLVLFQDKA